MPVETNNFYGKITISDSAIAAIAGFATLESYGIVDVVNKTFKDSVCNLFNNQAYSRGVKITNIENRIFIDIYLILKYGISISAVAETIKKTIKYKVENFTGMIVDTVNINVVGIKV